MALYEYTFYPKTQEIVTINPPNLEAHSLTERLEVSPHTSAGTASFNVSPKNLPENRALQSKKHNSFTGYFTEI
jgi:hypothetical protein